MATRNVNCYIAVCDLCGSTEQYEGGTPHLDTPEEAIQYALDNTTSYDEHSGWTLTHDKRLICDNVKDTAHEDAHAEAGKRMTCAMTVTFDI